jgi:hypothetical protein
MLARLDALDVISRKILAGKMRGERRSKRRGQSVEFADFRNYVTGDDLRFIDWNIYARLDKLFLKLFLEEEDLSLYVVVDTSGSMDFGAKDLNKALYAKRVAAALGYVGLVHSNRVNLFGVSGGKLVESGPMRGRPRVSRMLKFVEGLEVGGGAELGPMLKRFTVSARLRGVVVVISDFLDKASGGAGFDASLKYVAGGRYDLYAVQVLSPEEIDPEKAGKLTGDLKLKDAEDGSLAEVSLNAPLLKQYKATLNAYCLGLKDYLAKRGGSYLFSSTAVPFDTLVLAYLRRRGLLG